jgi:hypothetical protein
MFKLTHAEVRFFSTILAGPLHNHTISTELCLVSRHLTTGMLEFIYDSSKQCVWLPQNYTYNSIVNSIEVGPYVTLIPVGIPVIYLTQLSPPDTASSSPTHLPPDNIHLVAKP